MSHADDMMISIRGDIPKSIPYAPRFDIWFNAHQYRGTLPEIYADCSDPLDVSRRIGVAGHMVVPDYVRPEEPEDMYDRGIGIYHLTQVPYRAVMKGIDRTVSEHDGTTDVCYRTPKGTVTVSYSFTEDMRRSGSTISWVNRHAIQSPDDYEPLSYIFDHLDVEPSYSGLESMIRKTGGDALIVANGSMPASPMQYIMRDLMGMTELFMAMADEPVRLGKLADAIGGYFERLMPVAAACPAEVILLGANTDATITYPPFYEEHILPWLSRFTGMAHDRGKYVAIHADGENKGLFELYRQSGIDILEAVAPSPMTTNSIREILSLSEGMTVWGGIPSVILMPDWQEDDFRAYMEDVLDAVRGRSRFILGVSDTTPPDAVFERLLTIRDMCRNA